MWTSGGELLKGASKQRMCATKCVCVSLCLCVVGSKDNSCFIAFVDLNWTFSVCAQLRARDFPLVCVA